MVDLCGFIADGCSCLQVYDSFERRSKIQLNRFIRNHSIMKKYAFNADLVVPCADASLIFFNSHAIILVWCLHTHTDYSAHCIIKVMILRMRQLCCHPNLILVSTSNHQF